MSSDDVSDKIEELKLRAIDSEKNANCLVDLFPYLSSPEDEVVEASVNALCEVFVHYVQNYYDSVVPVPPAQCIGAEQVFHGWMHKNYLQLIQELLHLMKTHHNQDIQLRSLYNLMELVKTEATAHQDTHDKFIVPVNLFSQVVTCLLESNSNHLTSKFKRFMKYDDIRLYTLKHTSKMMAARSARDQDYEEFVMRNFELLQQVKMPTEQEEICKFFCGDPTMQGSETIVSKIPPKKDITRLEVHQHKFSDAWLAFLRLSITEAVYKQVLISLDTKVMPHLTDPRMLIDFLTDSYNLGGIHSILALNGLFILINEHNLDYPDFYTKLYTLLKPPVFHVKYLPRFFYLLDIFLTSTHLPLYLIAAFCKKIARLLLTAPPRGILIGMVTVVNLLKRHPNCKVLIHRAHPPLERIPEVDTDPFDADCDDPKMCHALDSCLWELQTLKSHYCPKVTKSITELLEPTNFLSKREEELAPYLELTDKEVFEEMLEMNEKPSNNTPNMDTLFSYIRTKYNTI
ncbi:nucleolar complex protein 4 homolog [Dysidea avara]|uniref:nucleolar complex protein 4 homolog n=1 Tax=Dysidea avara TaxID=196820 RepID=UPI003333ABE5